MDLHLARVQQRWRYAPDVLPPGQKLDVDVLAYDVKSLPVELNQPPDQVAEDMINFLGGVRPGDSAPAAAGGAIEVITESDEDGVLTANSAPPESSTVTPPLDLSLLEPRNGGLPCAPSLH